MKKGRKARSLGAREKLLEKVGREVMRLFWRQNRKYERLLESGFNPVAGTKAHGESRVKETMGCWGKIRHVDFLTRQELIVKGLVKFRLLGGDLGTKGTEFARFSLSLPEHEAYHQHHLSGGTRSIRQESALGKAAKCGRRSVKLAPVSFRK